MDLSFSPEELAFRDEVRAWVKSALPAHLAQKAEMDAEFSHAEVMEWHKILAKKGWAAPHWPQEVGGTGWDAARRFLFTEELEFLGAPRLSPFGLSMVGPLLIQFGNASQKARYLPKILSGEEVWCQGYSEPNAGSDLASLTLRAFVSAKDPDDLWELRCLVREKLTRFLVEFEGGRYLPRSRAQVVT